MSLSIFHLFFFNDTATTEIYTLSLHDALPISDAAQRQQPCADVEDFDHRPRGQRGVRRQIHHGCIEGPGLPDRKSTRLNSSHLGISYAVFCLKKKKKNQQVASATHRLRRRERE